MVEKPDLFQCQGDVECSCADDDAVRLVGIEETLKAAYMRAKEEIIGLKCDGIRSKYIHELEIALGKFGEISREVKPITLPFKAKLRNLRFLISGTKEKYIPNPESFKSLKDEEKLKIYNELFMEYQGILLSSLDKMDYSGICMEINGEFMIISEIIKGKNITRTFPVKADRKDLPTADSNNDGESIQGNMVKGNIIRQIFEAKKQIKDHQLVHLCPTKTLTNEVDAIILFRRLKTYILLDSRDHENELSLAEVELLCNTFAEKIEQNLNEYINLYTQQQLKTTKQKLEEQKLDSLTGFLSRKAFEERVDSIVEMAPRTSKGSSVICLFDLDHFKKINDTYGHDKGDEVIQAVSNIIRKKLQRKTDICVRRGGEELLVVLQDTNTNTAKQKCEEIRKEIENLSFTFDKEGEEGTFKVTITGGISSINTEKLSIINGDTNTQFSEIVIQADKSLYRGKRNGRNQIVVYDETNLLLDC